MPKDVRPNKVRTLEKEIWLAAPLETVFDFFSDAHNLEEITPPILKFRVLTPRPIPMEQGTLIDYKLSLRGFPMKWRTRIAVWEPPRRFVDMQLRGPYRWWHHTHTFESHNGGTRCKDIVEYQHLGGPIIDKLLVRPDVEKIFAYREQKMVELFGGAS
ncbi:MAG: SRPBCC family protein [Planctomycetota bacterium]